MSDVAKFSCLFFFFFFCLFRFFSTCFCTQFSSSFSFSFSCKTISHSDLPSIFRSLYFSHFLFVCLSSSNCSVASPSQLPKHTHTLLHSSFVLKFVFSLSLSFIFSLFGSSPSLYSTYTSPHKKSAAKIMNEMKQKQQLTFTSSPCSFFDRSRQKRMTRRDE